MAVKTHSAANQLSERGDLAGATRRYGEAMALYNEAYDLGHRTVNFLQAYAILLMRENQIEKARKIMLEIQDLKLTKDDWYNLRINFSICQWKMGQLDKAIETIRIAAREKMSSSIYNTLGMFLVDKARETGDFEEALQFNLEAMEYDDEDGATLDNMGQLYLFMSDAELAKGETEKAAVYREKARKFMEKAHACKPRQITTIYWLATLMLEAGETDQARELVHKADNIYFSALCAVSQEDMNALAAKIG